MIIGRVPNAQANAAAAALRLHEPRVFVAHVGKTHSRLAADLPSCDRTARHTLGGMLLMWKKLVEFGHVRPEQFIGPTHQSNKDTEK